MLTIQIEAEERFGRPQREALLIARAREDAAAEMMASEAQRGPR